MRAFPILLLFFLSLGFSGFSQSYQAYTNFETNIALVRIDTSLPSNLWQIGIPHKTNFDSAYSLPKAIVTDTVNPYEVNSFSSFYISIKDPNWFWGSPSRLAFYHKFNTDTLTDGGYIDVSYDGGLSWLNIIYDSTMFNCTWTPGFGYWSESFYGENDTLINGISGFSGNSNGWYYSTFEWMYCLGVDNNFPDSMMIRFNFISDSFQSNKDGWMIDNISLYSDYCGFISNNTSDDNSVTIFPNPAKNEVRIIDIDNRKIREISIYNQLGKQIKNLLENQNTINISDLPFGLYIVEVVGEGWRVRKKLIIQ